MHPQLFIDFGVLLFIGAIGEVARHDCAGTVVAFGLDQEFTLTTQDGVGRHRVAVVPSGRARAVDAGGARLGVCLVDPDRRVRLPPGEESALDRVRRLSAAGDLEHWLAFRRLLGLFPRTPARDPRIARVVSELRHTSDDVVPVAHFANLVGVSPSRLEHLFTAQVGCPMRSFRTWYRFRAAAEAFRTGGHMTSAAHAAGFYDSAHFARAFRQSFGLPPSSVLTPDLEIRLVGDNESLVARQADQ